MKVLIPLPTRVQLEAHSIVKELILAHRYLAELKGIIPILPNEDILLSNLVLKEAQDSSAIENIVTTQDSLYKYQLNMDSKPTADKEVYCYKKALKLAYGQIKKQGGLSRNTILHIQSIIEPKRSGFRKVPGTVIKNTATNQVIYTPPSPEKIPSLMDQLEKFIHNTNSIDPIIKMAIIHHYFESIHPFYDGNGRTGRIINILYLIQNNLLDSPVLYLSKYILKYRSNYYKLLQEVRKKEYWTNWIIYILRSVSHTAKDTIQLIKQINSLFKDYKYSIRKNHKFYSHDLINNIFTYPYTKVKLLEKEIKVSRATATRYLDLLAQDGVLKKQNIGRKSYYVNTKLLNLLQKC